MDPTNHIGLKQDHTRPDRTYTGTRVDSAYCVIETLAAFQHRFWTLAAQ